MTTYVVIQNVPGYLPMDDEPFTTTNRREAERIAAEMAREAIEFSQESDDPNDHYVKTGSARDGYISLVSKRPHDLGLVITIGEMDES